MVFQEPMTSLNPVFSIGDQIATAVRAHARAARGARPGSARRAMLDLVQMPVAARARPRLPAPALGRPAPARDDRDGAGLRAGAADRRRADDGARRHDPGADPRSPAAAPGGARHGGPADHPRPRRGRRALPPRGGHLRRAHRRDWRRSAASSRARCTRTRGASSSACRTRAASGEPLVSIEGAPPDLRRPPAPAAASRRAAPTPSRAAGATSRALVEREPGHFVACPVRRRDGRPAPRGRRASPSSSTSAARGSRGRRRVIRAVDGVSFALERGETLGLVGESGCGKSTTGRLILRLIEPTGGRCPLRGPGPPRALARGSSGPRASACRSSSRIRSARSTRGCASGRSSPSRSRSTAAADAAGGAGASAELLEVVGLDPAFAAALPARAVGRPAPAHRDRGARSRSQPSLIVADEPVSALDVSIQAQVLNLLMDLQPPLRPHLPLHLPRPPRGPAHVRPRGGDVPRRDRRDRRRGTRFTASPSIPTRRRCCRPSRSPIPRGAASASCPGARWRAPSPCRPVAASTRAARSRSTAAGSSARCLAAVGAGHEAACHLYRALRQPRGSMRRPAW